MPRASGAPTYIAEILLHGLTKLTHNEQTAVKAAIFELQVQPDLPSFQLHRVQAPDDGMWSARVDLVVRLILHKRGDTTVVCYADHRPTSAVRSPTCST